MLKKEIQQTCRTIAVIVSTSTVYGMMGFFYSFLGLLHYEKHIVSFEPFHYLTIQEIGGHFLFGFIPGLVSRNWKIASICGLMAITIDTDHLLYFFRLIEGRIDHSILFAAISSIFMGLLLSQINIFQKIFTSKTLSNKNSIFVQIFIISMVAFFTHIAYDTVIDKEPWFPFFAPFSFERILIPQNSGWIFEIISVLLIYLYFRRSDRKIIASGS